MQRAQRDVFLWLSLLRVIPNWVRMQQGIGDCVACGSELACTTLMCMQHIAGEMSFEAEAASETIYGGCRVEVNRGRSPLGNEDGAAGSWAAEWVMNVGGVLLRKDYSQITGNPDHDYRVYNAKKAKEHGYYGCGGKNDKGALDAVAKKYPVQDTSLIEDVDDCEAAIDNGCTITVASSAGYEGRRNNDGIIRRNGQWPHQMCILGKKYTGGGTPLFRLFNSWGKMTVEGPDPGITDKEINDNSWWITPEDLRSMLREQDSYSYSRVKNYAPEPWNLGGSLLA
jgi:hypothetical protein